MSADASTPLMRQYHGIKQQVPNTLLMFRLGDFYELFYDDAVTAARELEITLTARNKEKGNAIPMCGVPYHASENYIARLIQKGYRVAICDQMEVPTATTKLVRREVTRIVTPGTAMNPQVLRSHENNYLAAVMVSNGRAGIAHVDISTGEFRATEIDATEIRMALETLNAREALFPDVSPESASDSLPCLKTAVDAWVFASDYAARSLCDHFHLLSLGRLWSRLAPSLATGAAAAILHYLRDTQRTALDHLERPCFLSNIVADALILDSTTVRKPGAGRAAVCRRVQRINSAPCARSNSHGHGRPSPSPPVSSPHRLKLPRLRPAWMRWRNCKNLPSCVPIRANIWNPFSIWSVFLAKISFPLSAGPRDLLALARSLAVILLPISPARKGGVTYRHPVKT